MTAPAAPPMAEGDEALAALALIRAYAGRDLYTARHILARWDTPDRSFAAVVATTAAVVLTRVARGDRDEAEHIADEALDVYQGLVVRDLAV